MSLYGPIDSIVGIRTRQRFACGAKSVVAYVRDVITAHAYWGLAGHR